MGNDLDLSPAIMLVDDEVHERTPAFNGTEGDTKALAPAAIAKVAAISNFIVPR